MEEVCGAKIAASCSVHGLVGDFGRISPMDPADAGISDHISLELRRTDMHVEQWNVGGRLGQVRSALLVAVPGWLGLHLAICMVPSYRIKGPPRASAQA